MTETTKEEMKENYNSGMTLEEEDLSVRIRREALEAIEEEPELENFLKNTVLAPGVETFEDAVASTISFRLLPTSTSPSSMVMTAATLRNVFQTAITSSDTVEGGYTELPTMIRDDVKAVLLRDPACKTVLEIVLFFKGFAALMTHRVARQRWMEAKAKGRNKSSMVALFLQSQASSMFGVDIHPAATIGKGVLLDHGTGIVIGETAVVGDGCTLLHGVTLGGTGKEIGDRHPKIGKDVLIGAGASILGNIKIGDRCKIGAGSVVLRPIPSGATAVGAPAKIVGRVEEEKPGGEMDLPLKRVSLLHMQSSELTAATEDLSGYSSEDGEDDSGNKHLEVYDDDTSSSSDASSFGRNFCPYREYRRIAERAPPGTLTICMLANLLRPAGCSHEEVGGCFFAMDEKDRGYIKREYFETNGKDAILKHTSLTKEKLDELWDPFLAKIPISLKTYGKQMSANQLVVETKENQ